MGRLDENLGAAAIELTPDDLRDIEGAASKRWTTGKTQLAAIRRE